MKWVIFVCVLITAPLSAQWQLSEEAEISLITGGPYQGELYSAFGHSAVRVHDPQTGLDLLYNYGVFDFDQPNFYLNFARGNLLYKLAVMSYAQFENSYRADNRYIHEQVLHLDQAQAQAYFNFLQINARPENQEYRYDYFYDNCATRIRDGLEAVLGDSLTWRGDFFGEKRSIRSLCDDYLQQQAWGDLGIDLCLGLPMDREVDFYPAMFLPEYLEKSFAEARIITTDGYRPLVKAYRILYEPTPEEDAGTAFGPVWLGVLLLGLALISLLLRHLGHVYLKIVDRLLFGLGFGLALFLILLWFVTDHRAAADNLNLLWAQPALLWSFWALSRRKQSRVRKIYLFWGAYYLLLSLCWFFLPQDLHLTWWLFSLALTIRHFDLGGLFTGPLKRMGKTEKN